MLSFIDTAIVLSMFMLSFIVHVYVVIHWLCYCIVHVYVVIRVCDSVLSFWVEVNLQVFLVLFFNILSLEIHLSRKIERWDPINRFNSATVLLLSQFRTWISNVFNGVMWELATRFEDIGGIINHRCLLSFHKLKSTLLSERVFEIDTTLW